MKYKRADECVWLCGHGEHEEGEEKVKRPDTDRWLTAAGSRAQKVRQAGREGVGRRRITQGEGAGEEASQEQVSGETWSRREVGGVGG